MNKLQMLDQPPLQTEVREKAELNLEELIRQYNARKTEVRQNASDSDSWFVSESDNDVEAPDSDDANKKSYIPLYRKEHGGIIIYDVEGNIPGQPAPDYQGDDKDFVEIVQEDEDGLDNTNNANSEMSPHKSSIAIDFKQNNQFRHSLIDK